MTEKRSCEECGKPADATGPEGSNPDYCRGHQYLGIPGVRDVFAGLLERMNAGSPRAAQRQWECEDGYLVVYTTSRVSGGPHAGKFVTMLYTPRGKGARTGKATRFERTYLRPFSTRKAAKQRALEIYYQHSPKAKARHRWNGKGYGPKASAA